jgi:uncharacterized membrane protein
MAEYENSTEVSASADALFDYLSDVGNLPEYFSRIRSATPAEGEAVHTVAETPDGRTVEGEAWFRVDRGAKRLEWGSEGPSDYSGHLDVTAVGDRSRVEVHVSTSRVESPEVQRGVDETVAAIKRAVEDGAAA